MVGRKEEGRERTGWYAGGQIFGNHFYGDKLSHAVVKKKKDPHCIVYSGVDTGGRRVRWVLKHLPPAKTTYKFQWTLG